MMDIEAYRKTPAGPAQSSSGVGFWGTTRRPCLATLGCYCVGVCKNLPNRAQPLRILQERSFNQVRPVSLTTVGARENLWLFRAFRSFLAQTASFVPSDRPSSGRNHMYKMLCARQNIAPAIIVA